MKVYSIFLVLVCHQMFAHAQNFSYVYPLADTLNLQSSYWAEHDGVSIGVDT
jgi:hypothetical protein